MIALLLVAQFALGAGLGAGQGAPPRLLLGLQQSHDEPATSPAAPPPAAKAWGPQVVAGTLAHLLALAGGVLIIAAAPARQGCDTWCFPSDKVLLAGAGVYLLVAPAATLLGSALPGPLSPQGWGRAYLGTLLTTGVACGLTAALFGLVREAVFLFFIVPPVAAALVATWLLEYPPVEAGPAKAEASSPLRRPVAGAPPLAEQWASPMVPALVLRW